MAGWADGAPAPRKAKSCFRPWPRCLPPRAWSSQAPGFARQRASNYPWSRPSPPPLHRRHVHALTWPAGAPPFPRRTIWRAIPGKSSQFGMHIFRKVSAGYRTDPGLAKHGLPRGINHSTDRGAMSRTRTFIAATGAAAAMIGTSIVGAQRISQRGTHPRGGPDPGQRRPVHQPPPGGRHRGRQPEALGPGLAPAAGGGGEELRQRGEHARQRVVPSVPEPGKTYAARFGAPTAEAASVESWLRSAGFTGVTGQPAALLRPGHRRRVGY